MQEVSGRNKTKLPSHLFVILSDIGLGAPPPGSRIPPSSQSANPTNLAPTPFSQFPSSCAVSMVWLRIRPSWSKSNMKRPVKAFSASTPRPRPRVLCMPPSDSGHVLLLIVACDFPFLAPTHNELLRDHPRPPREERWGLRRDALGEDLELDVADDWRGW
jgi:hypothetical protein